MDVVELMHITSKPIIPAEASLPSAPTTHAQATPQRPKIQPKQYPGKLPPHDKTPETILPTSSQAPPLNPTPTSSQALPPAIEQPKQAPKNTHLRNPLHTTNRAADPAPTPAAQTSPHKPNPKMTKQAKRTQHKAIALTAAKLPRKYQTTTESNTTSDESGHDSPTSVPPIDNSLHTPTNNPTTPLTDEIIIAPATPTAPQDTPTYTHIGTPDMRFTGTLHFDNATNNHGTVTVETGYQIGDAPTTYRVRRTHPHNTPDAEGATQDHDVEFGLILNNTHYQIHSITGRGGHPLFKDNQPTLYPNRANPTYTKHTSKLPNPSDPHPLTPPPTDDDSTTHTDTTIPSTAPKHETQSSNKQPPRPTLPARTHPAGSTQYDEIRPLIQFTDNPSTQTPTTADTNPWATMGSDRLYPAGGTNTDIQQPRTKPPAAAKTYQRCRIPDTKPSAPTQPTQDPRNNRFQRLNADQDGDPTRNCIEEGALTRHYPFKPKTPDTPAPSTENDDDDAPTDSGQPPGSDKDQNQEPPDNTPKDKDHKPTTRPTRPSNTLEEMDSADLSPTLAQTTNPQTMHPSDDKHMLKLKSTFNRYRDTVLRLEAKLAACTEKHISPPP